MLKYSTGRGKPGWGKESCKPVWWPEDIPWANVRSDVSWTQALRTIVKNCYKQHGREDLLYAFEDHQVTTVTTTQHHQITAQSIAHLVPSQTVVQTVNNPDGTNWATLQGGEMTIQTTQASEATQAVASLAEAAVAASQEIQSGTTVTMALNSSRRLLLFLLQSFITDYPCSPSSFVLIFEAAAHAVATLAEATLQGGGQIVLAETAAA
ncbi:GTPase regulator Nrf1, partial [Xenoophorus captivus]